MCDLAERRTGAERDYRQAAAYPGDTQFKAANAVGEWREVFLSHFGVGECPTIVFL